MTTIVTLTPNPSVDRTLEIARLDRGAVLRARAERVDAGGKGVNVARALAANTASGVVGRAVLPLGGPDGHLLATLLRDSKITVGPVAVGSSTRSNVTLVEPDGTVTKVNAPGQPLLDGEVGDLLDACLADLAGVGWVVGCGSLPPGVPDDLYAALVSRGRAAGVRVAVDSSGAPLARAVEAGPDLVKPNLDELAELVGRPLATFDDVIEAAEGLRRRGVGSVVVSLGPRGAVLVEAGSEPVLAVPRPIAVRSDVGAGDALLAGFLATVAAGGRGPEALRAGVAWGAAAAGLPGTEMPGPGHIDLDAVTLRPARGAGPLTRGGS
jgi:1-phosphofructokinase family hexose kinase